MEGRARVVPRQRAVVRRVGKREECILYDLGAGVGFWGVMCRCLVCIWGGFFSIFFFSLERGAHMDFMGAEVLQQSPERGCETRNDCSVCGKTVLRRTPKLRTKGHNVPLSGL